MSSTRKDIIDQLKQNILLWQGFKPAAIGIKNIAGLETLAPAFPNGTFPTGVIHEFISDLPEHATATNAFISGIAAEIMDKCGLSLWISSRRTIYPPALRSFGVDPERVVFIDVTTQKEVLWAAEEALKCDVLTAVVAELTELTFAESRRLQLAVEKSHVTGFVHRYNPRTENTTTCVTRWKVRSVGSVIHDNSIPGIGFPCWDVQLIKVRNGAPGRWLIEWSDTGFNVTTRQSIDENKSQVRKTG